MGFVFRRTLRALCQGRRAREAARRLKATRFLTLEPLEPRIALAAAGLVPVGAQPTGPLTGKIVYTSPGHGWQWNTTLNRYATDRGDNNEIVEDFGNQDQMTAYADYLFRAGATVVPMRPIGRQLNEVVLDNDSPGVTFSGAWSNSTGTRYYDEDYGAVADAVPYRFANTNATESATATYTPNIPQAGFYPVYAWAASGTNRTSQLYVVNHTSGQTQVRVDHSKVGYGWVYLGTYYLNAGSAAAEGSVTVSNQGEAGKVVIADAIRFGNGMGDYVEPGAPRVSGYPREDENSYHWIARSIGVGTSLATAIGSGTSNVSAPSNFAQYMNADTNPFGTSVYIGFHSNAGGGRSARGLIDADLGDRTPHQVDLATYLGRQINQDMQALNGVFEYNWGTGTTHTYTGQFGEIDLGPSAEMDATIIEVAFHDSVEDAAIMRDPKGRDQIARSTYQGTLEYFQRWGGLVNPASVATAPTHVRAESHTAGEVTISWSAGLSSPASVHGGAATGFRVYASTDGYGFDGGTFVAGGGATSLTIAGYDPTLPYYFRVVAVNAGGESKPSEVVTALPSGGLKQVLIVNGFDRFDRTQDFRYAYAYTGDALVDRVFPRYNNSFDYVVQVHAAINASRPGVHVASTSNEAVISGAVDLTQYDTVVWILGEESTADHTFNAVEQTKVAQFLAGGGNLFVTGSEIAWDLDQQNNGRTFFETTLKGNFAADAANTYNVAAAAGGIFAGLANFSFSNGASFSNLVSQVYNVNSADVINPQAGAQTALTYSGGIGGSAAIQAAGIGGAGSLVMFGFPFESITNAAHRTQVMGRVLDFFGVAAPTDPTADFDEDGDVDGADFLAWQIGLGTTGVAATRANGNANGDADVDGDDLGVWMEQFGATEAIAAATTADPAEAHDSIVPIDAVATAAAGGSAAPLAAAVAPGLNPVGTQPEGNLSGKIFYINGGHGYAANNTGNGAWSYGRGLTNGIVEDLGNQDQMTFFADYLFRAGATIVPMRPVGNQPSEVVLDNDDPGVTFAGTWTDSGQSTFFGSAGDVPYRYAATSAAETAVARYTPNLPVAGFYPVYTWALAGSDRAADQLYRINYAGGSTEVTVNHRAVGTGLVYLGTYYFEAGMGGSVEISNRSSEAGRVVIADAIRFGNGMGDISRGGGGVSGRPREDELSLYWIMWQVNHTQGVSFNPTGSTLDSDSNVGVVPRYAAFMNREAEGSLSDRVLISFHTNAAGGRGVLGLYNGNNRASAKTPNQFQLAKALGQEVNDDLVAQNGQYEFNWFNAGQNTTLDRSDIEFGEINNEHIGGEFDATIVEVAYHDNASDAALLRDPKVRDAAARATYQGAVKFLRSIDGGATSLTMLPGKVTQVRAESVGPGSVKLTWTVPAANAYNGDAPTGYRIYGSTNGYGFDGGTFVAGGATTTFALNGLAAAEGAYFFKVVAVNSGGEGAASEVVAAIPAATTQKVLIVNGFDRLGRTQNPTQAVSGGQAERVRPRQSNSYDYAVQVAAAIEANTGAITVDTASNEMLISGAVQLGAYDAVVWISGEESTADDTFNATEQALVTSYLAAGGKLLVTGSEIGWDLDAQGGGAAFYNNQLKADYVADDANSYSVTGSPAGIFSGLAFAFDNGSQFYNVDFPDVIAATGGSIGNLTYSTGGVAGVQYANAGTGERVITFGFPFETITTFANRAAVMDRVLDYFGFTLVIVPTGDFDDDGDVDGADFLAWQRGLGTTPSATQGQGDSNLDGIVDAADLAVWSAQYGSSGAVAAAATLASVDVARAVASGESNLSLAAIAQAFALLGPPRQLGAAGGGTRISSHASKLATWLPAADAVEGSQHQPSPSLSDALVSSSSRGPESRYRGALAEASPGATEDLLVDRAFESFAGLPWHIG